MKQNYSSANTSINSKKLPAVYSKKMVKELHDCYLLDYGCGKYTDHIETWCKARNIRYLPYDPYNQTEATNKNSIQMAILAKACGNHVVGLCSNVLNVVDSDDAIQDIINSLAILANVALFTVYEGDKTGIGKATSADSYQRNEKLKNYLRFFPSRSVYRQGCILMF